jgi:hypothetical protein
MNSNYFEIYGYNIFCNEMLTKWNEELSGAVLVKIRKAWTALPHEDREAYEGKAQELNKQQEELINLEGKVGIKTVDVATIPSQPMKLSPYHIYIKKTMPILKEENPGYKISNLFTIAAEKWMVMTNEEKAEFVDSPTENEGSLYNNPALGPK